MECLIQFYEEKCALLQQKLRQTELERNELIDLLTNAVSEDKLEELKSQSKLLRSSVSESVLHDAAQKLSESEAKYDDVLDGSAAKALEKSSKAAENVS